MLSPNLINKGVILRPGRLPTDPSNPARTFIISGIGRGGTTLVAAILREAGIFLGEHVSDLVGEDLDILRILRSGDAKKMEDVIARRNRLKTDWGFKVPHIAAFLRYDALIRFRNPHLIIIFRDPVAIAVRHSLAEYDNPLSAVRDTTEAMNGLAEFISLTACPALLLSYEKALAFPEDFIDALTAFCALPADGDLRRRMISQIQPNSENYINGSQRRFTGVVERISNGKLFGWCCDLESLLPLDLDLLLGGQKVLTFKANQFRPDLVSAGVGNGNHGFSLNMDSFGAESQRLLQVRVAGRTFELENSGRRIIDYQT